MHSLVDLSSFAPEIKLDIRYARNDNFLGRPVYRLAKAFLQKPAAAALKIIHSEVAREYGLGIVVFDGYRPWKVTKLFYESVTPAQQEFFANPDHGSAHNRGMAVDLSLFDLKSGKIVEMPSDFDELSERAYYHYSNCSAEAARNRLILRTEMEKEGFKGITNEWWHFNFQVPKAFEILDLDFEEITPID